MNKKNEYKFYKRKKDGGPMDWDTLYDYASKNNGLIRASKLKEMGFDYRKVQRFINEEKLEKVKNGLYKLADRDLSEKDLIANLFPDGVICMNSALYYYGYIDFAPSSWCIAVNKDASKSRFKIDYPYVKPYYMEEEQLTLGAELMDFGNSKMLIYNKERLICDCLKYESKMDRNIFNTAIRAYINDQDKDGKRLLDYAVKRRIYNKVKDVLGIWI